MPLGHPSAVAEEGMQGEVLYIGWRINALLGRSEEDPVGTVQSLRRLGFTADAAEDLVEDAARILLAQHMKEMA